MIKKLSFAPRLVSLVLSGKKTSTWRLWDEKNLAKDDLVDLYNSKTAEKFAQAKIIKVVEKPLAALTAEDKHGHETFNSEKEMCATYTHYYRRTVTPDTIVKIVWFTLL